MSTDAENALNERKKMERGLPYDAMEDPDLLAGRLRARKYLKAYNDYPPATYTAGMPGSDYFGPDERFQILADLFGISLEKTKKIGIEPPFWCDYGTNIQFKGTAYMNFNTTILGGLNVTNTEFPVSSFLQSWFADCAKVVIGTRVMFGPNVQIYAATHSVSVEERRAGLERAYPVTIGDDVWIGGNVTLIGPCTIGNGVTVAAGAIVKGDVPDNVVVGGIPAKIIKHLDPPPVMKGGEAEEHGTVRVAVP